MLFFNDDKRRNLTNRSSSSSRECLVQTNKCRRLFPFLRNVAPFILVSVFSLVDSDVLRANIVSQNISKRLAYSVSLDFFFRCIRIVVFNVFHGYYYYLFFMTLRLFPFSSIRSVLRAHGQYFLRAQRESTKAPWLLRNPP